MPKTNSGNKEVDALNDAELASYFEAHKDDVSIWESAPTKIRVRRGGPSTIFSLRLSPKELEELQAAASVRGRNLSDFIRSAALAASRSDDSKDEAIHEALTSLRSMRAARN